VAQTVNSIKVISTLILLFSELTAAEVDQKRDWQTTKKKGVCHISSPTFTAPLYLQPDRDKTTQPTLIFTLNRQNVKQSHTKLEINWHFPASHLPVSVTIDHLVPTNIKSQQCIPMKNGATICYITGMSHKALVEAVRYGKTVTIEAPDRYNNALSWTLMLDGFNQFLEHCSKAK